MKKSELQKLIREEVSNVLNEATIDPNKKYYWFEYYPHYSGSTLKAEAAITGKTLMSLKKLYDSDDNLNTSGFTKVLKAASKGKTFYFTSEVFDEFWNKLIKSLAANKPFGSMTEEGFFAMSPNSMAEAKQMVKKIEREAEDDTII